MYVFVTFTIIIRAHSLNIEGGAGIKCWTGGSQIAFVYYNGHLQLIIWVLRAGKGVFKFLLVCRMAHLLKGYCLPGGFLRFRKSASLSRCLTSVFMSVCLSLHT